MRSKEEAHDYRYFPEPDLPPVLVDAATVAGIARDMPELPQARRQRFVAALALPDYDATILTASRAVADFFEATVAAGAAPKAASNWMMGELTRALNESGKAITDSPVSPERLAGLLALVDEGRISGAMAKTVFEKMFASGKSASDIVAADGLAQITDDAQIAERITAVLAANDDAVAQYRAGKSAALGFLVGQVMKATGGKANPKRVNELLKQML